MSRSDVLKLFGALVLGIVFANIPTLWGSFTPPPASMSVTNNAGDAGHGVGDNADKVVSELD
jgi:hypothetical protein